jgi:hypothetical protein
MTTSTNVSFHNVKFCNALFEFPPARGTERGGNTIQSTEKDGDVAKIELACSNLLGSILFLCTLAIVSLVVVVVDDDVTDNPNTIRVLFPLHNAQEESRAN